LGRQLIRLPALFCALTPCYEMNMQTNLYFGYGSNLDRDDWGRFCQRRGFAPDCVTPVGPASLPDHALVFNYHSLRRGGGVLNVVPHPGSIVSGWLFRYDEEGLRALDVKEGVPHAYRREQVVVLDDAHEEHRVLTYRVIEENTKAFVTPASEYLSICRRARMTLGIDCTVLEEAACGRGGGACHSVFVYGTLMSGERRHDLWRDAPGLLEVAPAEVPGRLVDCGAYPGLAPILDADDRVRGELLRFETLGGLIDAMDAYEDFGGYGASGNQYRRIRIEAQTEQGESHHAWAYLYLAADGLPQIAGGCWRTHRAQAV
jgi:gamma-glutamylcyclotransferase (GGCT)/AIG2-like uncharacterized protein YtfP